MIYAPPPSSWPMHVMEDELRDLRRALISHPSVEALHFVAPFIRDAIAAGTWAAGPGTAAVERELAAALRWVEKREREAARDEGGER